MLLTTPDSFYQREASITSCKDQFFKLLHAQRNTVRLFIVSDYLNFDFWPSSSIFWWMINTRQEISVTCNKPSTRPNQWTRHKSVRFLTTPSRIWPSFRLEISSHAPRHVILQGLNAVIPRYSARPIIFKIKNGCATFINGPTSRIDEHLLDCPQERHCAIISTGETHSRTRPKITPLTFSLAWNFCSSSTQEASRLAFHGLIRHDHHGLPYAQHRRQLYAYFKLWVAWNG